jgi:hypothetical protein
VPPTQLWQLRKLEGQATSLILVVVDLLINCNAPMKTCLFIVFCLLTVLTADYEYQLDPVITECNTKYGRGLWEFCPILKIPYEIKNSLSLPNIFRGYIVDGDCSTRLLDPGMVWENNNRDSSYLIIKYWSKWAPKNIKYKIYWFISRK